MVNLAQVNDKIPQPLRSFITVLREQSGFFISFLLQEICKYCSVIGLCIDFLNMKFLCDIFCGFNPISLILRALLLIYSITLSLMINAIC